MAQQLAWAAPSVRTMQASKTCVVQRSSVRQMDRLRIGGATFQRLWPFSLENPEASEEFE
jgi:hypothetical protein